MKTKILIVDDRKENIVALSQLIAADDVELHCTEFPEEALSMILDHEFGLALLDVQMPVMNGFELARLIRGIDRGSRLPIIFVTAANQDSQLIGEGYSSGAVDLLFKPLDPNVVRSKVRVFVDLDHATRQLRNQVTEMASLKEEAEAADLAKTRFLANMSHEVRTPLSAVLGFADILSQTDLSNREREEYLASISRNGKLLLRIIDDVLDLSSIEARGYDVEKAEVDLGLMLSDLETTLKVRAESHNVQLRVNRMNGASDRYITDALRLKQILLNVIGNAVKFTENGQVTVTIEARESRRMSDGALQGHDLFFSIKDTGVGITEKEAQKLFEPFSQADASTRRKFGGTGLGLVISRKLARSLGGDVRMVESRKGGGSTFEVVVRVQQAPKRTEKASAPTGDLAGVLKGKKILVVDDVADNRTLVERYLTPSGAVVSKASGGAEALAHIEKDEADLILMDIQMPEMDGYEATSKLRAMGYKKPIVALTAHAMRDELDRCLKAGCDMTLTKPITKVALVEHLAKILA
ncbi:MAG: hybrid sensor histidine kinase/response regulator [Proteobacteria bacterium]|nr:MAG: hybrid sensor histidine kinase/response regulator [Pseudomonadota bacterium]